MMTETQIAFAESFADYIEEHKDWELMSKRTAVIVTVSMLMGDIGACQGLLDAIGLDIDLYNLPSSKPNEIQLRYD